MRLPVVGTLRVTFQNLANRSSSLLRILALPAILLLALNAYIWRFANSYDIETDDILGFGQRLGLLWLLSSVLWALLAVSCHRVLLGDPREPTPLDGVWVGIRQLKYMLRAVVAALPIFTVSFGMGWSYYLFDINDIPPEIRSSISWVILIPAQYICSRFVLTLPAAALQENMSFAGAWSLSRGNGWRITAVVLAAPAAFKLLSLVVFTMWPVESVATNLLWYVIGLLVAVIAIASLSFSYEWLTRKVE